MYNNVLVIGAGPVGLCLSLALAARGLEVDLIERQAEETLAEPAFDGREIALTHASMRLLRDLGVWRHLPHDEIFPLRRARVMDGAHPGFEVDSAAFGGDQLGRLVSNHLIRAAAWKAVAERSDIRVHTGTCVEAVETDAGTARAHLAGGGTREAALLVAADSRFSETRRAIGIPVHLHDFGKSMLVCRMQHAEPNHAVAREWFGRGQTRALLPLGDHLSSMVLTVPGREAQALMQLPEAAFSADLTSRCEGILGEMTLASTRHVYPLVATWARRFVAQRFALAGDAAVGVHPVTAHGFNLGLASVEHLAGAAGDGWHRYHDAGDASMLARYQRRHRLGSAPMFAGTQAVAGIFTSERPPMRTLRRAIVGVGRRLPPLRRALAVGLLDESPRPRSPLRHLRTGLDILRPRLRGKAVRA